MFSLVKAHVVERIKAEHGCIELRVEVDGKIASAVAFETLCGDIAVGDEVVVNTTAVDLALGSGGKHFVLWNLANDSVKTDGAGHIMKLRYTPLQHSCLAVEEQASPHHEIMSEAVEIGGIPVIVGTLHSQLAPAAATLKHLAPDIKVAYIMTDGAALPIALSNTVAELKEKNLVDVTITADQAFGGDLEAINVYSALAAAKHVAKADVTIVAMGPGIVGSDTPLGFSGIEQGQIVNAVASLGGRPIAIPRISFRDERERHRGLSHHTVTALEKVALAPCAVAFPEMDEEKAAEVMGRIERSRLFTRHHVEVIKNDVTKAALACFGLRVSTMGRGFDEEPEFFLAAGAAAILAARMIEGDTDAR